MPYHELVIYMTFVVGFAITPGPNMMLYLAHTFEYGRKAGWATVFGITTAFLFHVTALVVGLTALLVSHPYSLEIIRYSGIAYLFYLAWKNLRTVSWTETGNGEKVLKGSHFYLKGLVGNLLNPGTLFLYFSLIPQFIRPERGHILEQNLFLCGMQMLGSTCTNCLVVFIAGLASERFFRNERYQQRIRYVMSALIVVFAIRLLFWKM